MTSTDIAAASKIMLGTTEAVAMYIGSTQIWQAGGGQQYQANGLPVGWTELEYISSTASGSQYIDLNIKIYETADNTYDIATKFKFKGSGSDTSNQATLFGCQRDQNPWPGTFIRRQNNDVIGRYIGGSNKDNTLGQKNDIIELPVQTPPNKNVYTSVGSSTHDWGTSLFCYFSNSSNTPARFIEADLYYFKLWLNGSLVRDMVPCKDDNDVVGLYDVVNHVFYTSPNSAAFVAGPAVV